MPTAIPTNDNLLTSLGTRLVYVNYGYRSDPAIHEWLSQCGEDNSSEKILNDDKDDFVIKGIGFVALHNYNEKYYAFMREQQQSTNSCEERAVSSNT